MEHLPGEITIIILLSLASLVAILARRVRLPYTIALVLTGLTLGVLRIAEDIPLPQLTPHFILVTCLPGLVFEAAFHLDYEQLRENIRPITVLAVPGVILSAGVVGTVLHLGLGLRWPVALLFGTLISATDPISVVALFRELGAPRRLAYVVEGESLFNDGTSIVFFRIIQGIILAGAFSLGDSVRQFVQVVFGGAVMGLAVGYLFARLMERIDDHLVEITLTVVLAYGVYLLAETAHVSGVIAVVVAGLIMGNYGARTSMSPTTKLTLVSFWEYVAFLTNSLIFLLLGMQVNLPLLGQYAVPILWAIGAVLVGRAAVVYLLCWAIHRLSRPIPPSWQHVLFWGGVRGSISLALALSLDARLAERELLQVMAFGYVLFGLVVQGLTVGPLIKRLRLAHRSPVRLTYERLWGRMLARRRAWRTLQQMQEDGVITQSLWRELGAEYRLAGQQLMAQIEQLYQEHPELLQSEATAVRRECLQVERSTLWDLWQRGEISEEVYRDLSTTVDRELDALQDTEMA